MKIAVAANGSTLDAPVSPILGRCPTFLLVDTETMEFEVLTNPALSASGGAGVQSAQFLVSHGTQAIVAGNVGPNAFGVFNAAGVKVYLLNEGTVKQAVETCIAGQLAPASSATVASHTGMGRRRGR